MTTGARGRRRDFDLETAIRIAIIAELVRFGCPAKTAAYVAGQLGDPFPKRLLCAAVSARRLRARRRPSAAPRKWENLMVSWEEQVHTPPVMLIQASSDEEIPEKLRKHFPQRPPSFYAVINIEEFQERMRLAEAEWEQARESKQ
jgi:hypothetical protein